MNENNSITASGNRLLLTVAAVMSETGFGRTTVYSLVASGEIPSVRVGRAVRIPRAALQSWIEKKAATGSGREV